ncbi:hypothetical protein VKT23_019689 [Stygiomarasmius scandens]|uniref:F-box domain-containing protein n=1 Tax=Marasmiellus scandens TaxID=2682957 RepID=A0ABR1IQ79_9AGAR
MGERDDSTHSILIPEILGQVFEYLTPSLRDPPLPVTPHVNPPRKRDLVSCALSCRLFASLALGLIWREMDTLLPLLQLLPGLQLVHGYYVLVNVLTETDLARFDYYAALVKEYNHFLPQEDDEDIIPRINTSIYSRIARLRPILLPSLTKFYCDADSFHDRVEIDNFASPFLKDVKIRFISSSQKATEVLMYLSLLASQATDVRKLDLSLEGSSAPACLQTVSLLKNLTYLRLFLDAGASSSYNTFLQDIESLGTLESLEYLSIRCSHTQSIIPPTYTLRSTVTPDTFKSLKTLTVHGDYPILKTIFDLCRYSPIHQLDFEPVVDPRTSRMLKQGIAQWKSTLRDVAVNHFTVTDDEVYEMSRDIEHLTCLPNLEILVISFVYNLQYTIRDEDVVTIAEAWPGLEKLELWVKAEDFRNAPSVTVLKVLADKCRNLKSITMPLNLDVPEIPANASSLNPSSMHGLESLEVCVNPSLLVERLYQVRADGLAYWIWSAFPQVQSVRGTWYNAFSDLWKNVEEEVKKLQGRSE